MMSDMDRQCTLCQETKPLIDFVKVKARIDSHGFRCKQCLNAQQKKAVQAYKAKNGDKVRSVQREAYWENVEQSRQKNRDKYRNDVVGCRQRTSAYAARNPLKRREWGRIWASLNRERLQAKTNYRRRLTQKLSELDKFVLSEAAQLSALRTECLQFSWQIDHIVPIAKGGTNAFDNIQVVPAKWNASKGARHTQRFFG
jgi:5-methylcytosine-specific restriction endonuclease McrA